MTTAPETTLLTGESGSRLQAPGSRYSYSSSASSLEPRAWSQAITLVELLVVLSVIGIVVGMSVPGLVGYGKQARLKTATREVLGIISLARSLAISSRAERAVVVDAEREEIRVVDPASGEALEDVVRLPSAVTVELLIGGEPTSETQFVFRPSGALAGRTVSLTLTEGDRRKTIVITGPTGAVAIQQSDDG